MIECYYSIQNEDSESYQFEFIEIGETKKTDDNFLAFMQKKILRSYRSEGSLIRKKERLYQSGKNRKDLEAYLQQKVIPEKITNFDLAVRYGDFGEIFASQIIKFIKGEECFNKLKWKFNKNKSVFGTDIVSFDSISNPQAMTYFEVKTRQNVLHKEVARTEHYEEYDEEKHKTVKKKKDIYDYITVIAYDSLKKDIDSCSESILDFMWRLYEEKAEYELAGIYSDLVDGIREINKAYEVFIITDSSYLVNKNLLPLEELDKVYNKSFPVKMTFIYIEDLKSLITQTWDTIAKNGASYIEKNEL